MQRLVHSETVDAYLRAKKRAKRALDVADATLTAIMKEYEPGDSFLVGKRVYFLKDKLAGGEIGQFHATKFTRYELELVGSEPSKKRKKK